MIGAAMSHECPIGGRAVSRRPPARDRASLPRLARAGYCIEMARGSLRAICLYGGLARARSVVGLQEKGATARPGCAWGATAHSGDA